jgi:hypothetical protein
MASTATTASTTAPTRRRRPRIFWWMGLAAVAAAFTGFFKTFTLPRLQGTFHAPPVVYLHGAALLAWVLLFALQVGLVQTGRLPRHRQLGWIALLLAPIVVLLTIAIGVFAMHRDLAAGAGETAISSLLGNITAPVLFCALVFAGLHYRRRPDVHKRLMLIALVVIIWPAFFRLRHYFPGVPRPEWVFGFAAPQCLLLLAMLRDRLVDGRVHRVYWWVGLPVLLDAALETWLFDGPLWRSVARVLAAPFLSG